MTVAVSAACAGWAARAAVLGRCSAVMTMVPARVAARAWTGAIAGSRGTGRPQAAAVTSAITAAAKTAHSSQAAPASTVTAVPPLSGLAASSRACCQPGQCPGSGGPASRPSPQGRPASKTTAPVTSAAARSRRARRRRAGGPVLPRPRGAQAAACTVTAAAAGGGRGRQPARGVPRPRRAAPAAPGARCPGAGVAGGIGPHLPAGITARLTRPAALAAATCGTTSRGRSSTATVSPAAPGTGRR